MIKDALLDHFLQWGWTVRRKDEVGHTLRLEIDSWECWITITDIQMTISIYEDMTTPKWPKSERVINYVDPTLMEVIDEIINTSAKLALRQAIKSK